MKTTLPRLHVARLVRHYETFLFKYRNNVRSISEKRQGFGIGGYPISSRSSTFGLSRQRSRHSWAMSPG